MTFDFENVLRRTRVARKARSLTRGSRDDYPIAEDLRPLNLIIMPDTCLYIDMLRGTADERIKNLLKLATVKHSSVALSELVFTFGTLDPEDGRTKGVLEVYEKFFAGLADRQISTPAANTSLMASIRAGAVSRCMGYKEDHLKKRVFSDALIAAHAVQEGAVLITNNLADFDLLKQMDPMLGMALYTRQRAP